MTLAFVSRCSVVCIFYKNELLNRQVYNKTPYVKVSKAKQRTILLKCKLNFVIKTYRKHSLTFVDCIKLRINSVFLVLRFYQGIC